MEEGKDKRPAVTPEVLALADRMYQTMRDLPWQDAAKAMLITANRISIQQTGVGLRLIVAPLLEVNTEL